MSNYHVGQVLYVVPKGKTTVFPMIIVEEIIKKTLQGEVRTYVLQGGTDKETHINLDDVKGDVFETLDDLRSTLSSRMQRYLDNVIEIAKNQVQAWYPDASQVPAHVPETNAEQASAAPSVIDLGNGVVARVKLPDALKG